MKILILGIESVGIPRSEALIDIEYLPLDAESAFCFASDLLTLTVPSNNIYIDGFICWILIVRMCQDRWKSTYQLENAIKPVLITTRPDLIGPVLQGRVN